MKHYTTNVLVLGAALLWGSAAAYPPGTELEAGVQKVLAEARGDLLATDGPVVKAYMDYITATDELGNLEGPTDEERARLVKATGVGTTAIDALLGRLKMQLLAADADARAAHEKTELRKHRGVVDKVAASFISLREQGVSDETIEQHINNLICAIIMGSDGSISKGNKLGAIAKITGANKALVWHANNPRIMLYAVIATSALAVGGMIYAAAKYRQPLSDRAQQWFADFTFGSGAKSFSLSDNLQDSLFTPLHIIWHPKKTLSAKPVLCGLVLGAAGIAGIATLAVLRKKRIEPDDDDPTKGRWGSLAGFGKSSSWSQRISPLTPDSNAEHATVVSDEDDA